MIYLYPHPEYDFPGLKDGDKWCFVPTKMEALLCNLHRMMLERHLRLILRQLIL